LIRGATAEAMRIPEDSGRVYECRRVPASARDNPDLEYASIETCRCRGRGLLHGICIVIVHVCARNDDMSITPIAFGYLSTCVHPVF